MNLFFDLETIPADDTFKKIAIDLTRKKLQKRAKRGEKIKIDEEEIFRWTAISGDFGRIFCIGYALGDGKVDIIRGSEAQILNEWWKVADNADLFVGHNIMDFDLRFIYKRSIVNKIKPVSKHLNLSFARYRSFPIYDTMREWEKWSMDSFISLDTLAKVLGLPTSKDGGIDGSKVYDFYLEKKFDEIYEYCIRDVELTRKIWRRMSFIE